MCSSSASRTIVVLLDLNQQPYHIRTISTTTISTTMRQICNLINLRTVISVSTSHFIWLGVAPCFALEEPPMCTAGSNRTRNFQKADTLTPQFPHSHTLHEHPLFACGHRTSKNAPCGTLFGFQGTSSRTHEIRYRQTNAKPHGAIKGAHQISAPQGAPGGIVASVVLANPAPWGALDCNVAESAAAMGVHPIVGEMSVALSAEERTVHANVLVRGAALSALDTGVPTSALGLDVAWAGKIQILSAANTPIASIAGTRTRGAIARGENPTLWKESTRVSITLLLLHLRLHQQAHLRLHQQAHVRLHQQAHLQQQRKLLEPVSP
jgi:hypothetical protein